jgi:hypothetical protein
VNWEDYGRELRGALTQAGASLSPQEQADVNRLIDHNEGPEAMLLLAELIVQRDAVIPSATRRLIKDLGWDDAEWPAGF